MNSQEIIKNKAEELAQEKYGKDFNELNKDQQLELWIKAHNLYADKMFGHWFRNGRRDTGQSKEAHDLYVPQPDF
jgi:hypothetical protein